MRKLSLKSRHLSGFWSWAHFDPKLGHFCPEVRLILPLKLGSKCWKNNTGNSRWLNHFLWSLRITKMIYVVVIRQRAIHVASLCPAEDCYYKHEKFTSIFIFFLPQKATKPPVLLIEMGNRKRVMPFEVLFSSICCWLYNNCAPRTKRCNVVSCGSSQADYETFNESPI